jgi:hypothetical protein
LERLRGGNNMSTLGTWTGSRDIEIVEVEGRPIALSGWNGEQYLQCWEVDEIISGTGFLRKRK